MFLMTKKVVILVVISFCFNTRLKYKFASNEPYIYQINKTCQDRSSCGYKIDLKNNFQSNCQSLSTGIYLFSLQDIPKDREHLLPTYLLANPHFHFVLKPATGTAQAQEGHCGPSYRSLKSSNPSTARIRGFCHWCLNDALVYTKNHNS